MVWPVSYDKFKVPLVSFYWESRELILSCGNAVSIICCVLEFVERTARAFI